MNYLAWLTEVNNALSDSRDVKDVINDSANSSQIILAFLEEIEDFLDKYQIKDPSIELPRDYNNFLVRHYNHPILRERIYLILENKRWEIENGNVQVQLKLNYKTGYFYLYQSHLDELSKLLLKS